MLDAVVIFHKGGCVLWSKYYFSDNGSVVRKALDHLISNVLLMGIAGDSSAPVNIDALSIQYSLDNQHNIIFAVSVSLLQSF